ncbi:MAG: hypothetical protein PHX58_14810 [Desulfovibrio sp.]|nr:hypothetical protein [Desulfovibrio sp.]
MGISLDILCRSCGWTETFRLGMGADIRLAQVAGLAAEDQRQLLSTLLKAHPDHAGEFEFRLWRCPACSQLVEQLHVSLLYGNGRHWESAHCCPMCGAPLLRLEDPEEVTALPCPQCGEPLLEIETLEFWDELQSDMQPLP